jgi:hypothetical protein
VSTNRWSKDRAIEVARSAAAARGLPWRLPIKVFEVGDELRVVTGANAIGGNVVVTISRSAGTVVSISHHDR